jgi:hypothetical protein
MAATNTASESSARSRLRPADRYSYCAKTIVERTFCRFAVSGVTARGLGLKANRWKRGCWLARGAVELGAATDLDVIH